MFINATEPIYINYMKMAMGTETKNLTAHGDDAVIDKKVITMA